MTRRLFLQLTRALGTVFVAAAVAPPLVFWWRSARQAASSGESWIDLGVARKIPQGEWLTRRFSLERQNRWRNEVVEELVYVHRVERQITVLSAVCPHARCLVSLREGGFSCRCHRSSFDGDGRVLDGPSPRPLDALEWKVRKGHLLVRYQQFRPGVARSEALRT